MRTRRQSEPWSMYHVYSRGAAKQVIFPEDADRLFFLEKLASLVEETGFEVFLVCLMDNHFHLGLRTSDESLSRFMQRLQTSYAVYFNHRYERSGHVIQGRFQARKVQGHRQLLQLSRYIHLNPVNTKAMDGLSLDRKLAALRAYPWSSYRGYLGLSTRHSFIDYNLVLNFFEDRKMEPARRYRVFVENGLRYSKTYLRKLIEDPGFTIRQNAVDALEDLPKESRSGPDPDWILNQCASHFNLRSVYLTEPQYYVLERTMTAKLIVEVGRRTQQEAATMLGWNSNAALSIQLRNFRKKYQDRPDVQERFDTLKAAVERAAELGKETA